MTYTPLLAYNIILEWKGKETVVANYDGNNDIDKYTGRRIWGALDDHKKALKNKGRLRLVVKNATVADQESERAFVGAVKEVESIDYRRRCKGEVDYNHNDYINEISAAAKDLVSAIVEKYEGAPDSE